MDVRQADRGTAVRPKSMTEDVKAGYLAPYDSYRNRIATLRFVQDIPLSNRHPSWKTVADIQKGLCRLAGKPMKICWGMKDFCFNADFLEKWMAYFPGAQVSRYPDDGHYLFEDAGDKVVAEIAGFLQEEL